MVEILTYAVCAALRGLVVVAVSEWRAGVDFFHRVAQPGQLLLGYGDDGLGLAAFHGFVAVASACHGSVFPLLYLTPEHGGEEVYLRGVARGGVGTADEHTIAVVPFF